MNRYHGHERCVWAILDSSCEVDVDALDHNGSTALVNGYLMLYQRPDDEQVLLHLKL